MSSELKAKLKAKLKGKREKYKSDYIYFPLCCLNYPKDISEIANSIMRFGIVEYATKLKNEIGELKKGDSKNINNFVYKYDLSGVETEADKFIILSAMKLNVGIEDFEKIKRDHKDLQYFIYLYESEYGKDAKVKVHKELLTEVRNGKFEGRMFRVYSAIVSIIGNKDFVRITNKRISYRMLGFKSEDVYLKEKSIHKVITARQIKTTVDKLSEKNFFAVRTYRNRLTFYSTKYRHDEFNTILINSIAMNKAKKEVKKIKEEKINYEVAEKTKDYIKKILSGETINLKMELYKAS